MFTKKDIMTMLSDSEVLKKSKPSVIKNIITSLQDGDVGTDFKIKSEMLKLILNISKIIEEEEESKTDENFVIE